MGTKLSTDKIKYFLDKAKESKKGITEKYNEVLNYTNVSYLISEEKSESSDNREIEEVVSESITTLVNFVMSNVFPRGLNWASLEINETLYNQASGDTKKVTETAKVESINAELEKMSGTFFDFLNNSNFYTEVAKAVRDVVVLGTGVIKLIEQTDTQRPFLYKYQNLDGLYFLENMLGESNVVFKSLFQMTKEDITELYGDSATIPSKAQEENKTVDLIECVIQSLEDKSIFIFSVYDSNFETLVHEVELKYNPFVVFRWSLESNSIWGVGLGILALKLFKELQKFKELREKQSLMIVEPPLMATGDKGLINNIVLKPGYANYGGTGQNSPMGNGFNGLDIKPIITSQSLIPVDQDINTCKYEIKSLFMSNPLGDLGESKNRSATEVQARMQLFRSRWSGAYELMQQELMRPTFLSPLRILIDRSILSLSFEESDLDFTVIQYENELSKASDIEDVQMLNTYGNSALNLANVAQQVGLNREKTVGYISKKLRVPLEIKLTEEENLEQSQRMQEYQDKIMAEKALMETVQEQGQEPQNQNQEVAVNG